MIARLSVALISVPVGEKSSGEKVFF